MCVCVTTPGCAKGKSVHMAHSMVSVNVRPHYPKVDVGVDGIYHRFTHLSWKMMIIDRVWGTQF